MQTRSLRSQFFRYSMLLVLLVIVLQLILFTGYEFLHEYVEEEKYWHALVDDKEKLKILERDHLMHELKEVMVLTVVGAITAPIFLLFVRHISLKALKPLEDIAEATRQIGDGQTTAPLPEYPGNNEISMLVTTLNVAFQRYQHSLAQARRFSADASHQLRTPLAVIRSAGEVALSKPRDSASYQETLHVILEETQRLEHIVEQLLSLAHLQREEVRKRFAVLHVGELLQHIDDQYRLVAESKNIDWTISLPDDWILSGDEALLVEAIANLVDNALHVTPNGGRIHVQALHDGPKRIIRVSDSGPGVSPAHRAHIFDRFHRANEVEYEGSGLGLSIVQAIAELHDARLALEPNGGSGASFTLVFEDQAV
ncbi:MAG: signal transduction histidine kinase [Kiritimatiellia bacterium]|jgi:signal transduction histidine kinase